MALRRAAAALLWLLPHISLGDPTLNRRANAQWVCAGCKDESHEREIFGQIHQALHDGRLDRTVYFTIDMAWIDDMLLPDAQVQVTLVDPLALSAFVHPETALDHYEKSSASKVYHLVVSSVFSNETTVRHPYRSSRNHVRDMHSHKLSAPAFGGVDAFLTANPCWIPLCEPVIHLPQQHQHTGKRRRRLASQTHSHESGNRLLVLAAMPHTPLHTTCVLYSLLHRTQFPPPAQCKYDDDHMTRYDLPNVGYASILVQVVDAFADNYCNTCSAKTRKIFIAPQAEDFYSRKLNITDPVTRISNETHDGWSWADPDSCPLELQHHDPWSCNFMALTSCTNRHLSKGVKKATMKIWYTPTNFLAENKLDLAARKSCGDATGAIDEHWAQQRFAAWMQRPNAHMRHLIRHSMHQLFALGLDGSPGAGGGGNALRELHHGPCVAIHVRHNDGMLDHRAQSGVDRSFAAHVRAARPFLQSLGAKKVFLATDNVTVLETAGTEYPEFVFFSQRRPMSTWVRFFGQFTKKYASKDNINEVEDKTITLPGYNIRNGSTYLDLQEGVASTLSHILADWRMAAACSAAVGTFDSGYTQRMFQTMCAAGRKSRGMCPPSTDLRKAAGK